MIEVELKGISDPSSRGLFGVCLGGRFWRGEFQRVRVYILIYIFEIL
jgi:hypothetical protein